MRHPICIFVMSVLTLNALTSALAKGKTVSEVPRVASATITSPLNSSVVAKKAIASGECSPSAAGDISVFVWPERSPGWGYPQSPNSYPASCKNEQWKTPIFFQGEPQPFEIAVYVATAAASAVIKDFLRKGARSNNYPGMHRDLLPDGLVEPQRVRVTKP
jgi:hypothetical protein